MPPLWQRLPFAGRLLVTASIALLVAGLVMVTVAARQEAADVKEELRLVLDQELETLPATLAEVVVIGDFATLQQTLDRYVSRPLIVEADYQDNRGGTLRSRDRTQDVAAPRWFLDLFDYREISGKADVVVGGRVYGHLDLSVSPALPAYRTWLRLLQHMAILLLAVVVDFIGIWLVLRFGLRPLARLERGAEALAEGRLETRLPSEGAPELRRLIEAFNRMAGAIQGAQGELREYQDHLEVQVQHRTEELRQALMAAEAANRAKSLFLSNMSHELRTPLNAILGFAQLMDRDASLASDHRRQIATIQRSGQHLLALINDVLEISRIEAGRTRVEYAPFDLPETIAAIEEMVRVRAEAKLLALRVEIAGDLPRYCLGDAHHLRQVLINLLGNAVKFTDRGEVSLRVEVQEGGTVYFEVADTGPGIPEEEQEQVFQAFYQTDLGAARGEGTGLGLTISREFVHLMGGELTLASAPGQGTRFAFTLALPSTSPPSSAGRAGRVIGLAPDQPTFRILVAEDKADNLELALRLLGGVGFEARGVANGREAVEEFQRWRPHLIWMDMRMPVMDGYAATRAIRALPGGDTVRIGALTASAFQEDRAAILEAGCDELMRKPIEEDRLFAVMAALLGVRYTYENAPAEAVPEQTKEELADGVAALPEKIRLELIEAATLLDMETAHRVVETIRPQSPETAQGLHDLIDDFRFDRVLELCKPETNLTVQRAEEK